MNKQIVPQINTEDGKEKLHQIIRMYRDLTVQKQKGMDDGTILNTNFKT
jgi:hypothetical protein